MVAHLDAIYGAGILDNATGSAAILDIAQKMRMVVPKNKLRFIWLGGKELGQPQTSLTASPHPVEGRAVNQ